MGKNNRATRKELEKVIGQLIKKLRSAEYILAKYIEFKGDGMQFSNYLTDSSKEERMKGGEKQKREKIQQPL